MKKELFVFSRNLHEEKEEEIDMNTPSTPAQAILMRELVKEHIEKNPQICPANAFVVPMKDDQPTIDLDFADSVEFIGAGAYCPDETTPVEDIATQRISINSVCFL